MKNLLFLSIATLVFIVSCKEPKPKQKTVESEIINISTDTMVVNEWKHYYDSVGVDGSFVLYSPTYHMVKVYNPSRANTRLEPASTFKIFNSLVSLETGVVKDENEILKWDGKRRKYNKLNQDLDMKQAFKYSALWFYQEMARRIGEEKMQYWLDTVGYGNRQIKTAIDKFWLGGGVEITPYEQIVFLESLYNNKLPFSEKTMEKVKEIMLVDDSTYIMRAKTGWTMYNNISKGWYVGWVEKDGEPYFFANVIDIPTDDKARARIDIVLAILKSEHIIE
jgi:beta-lactamase class D